MSVRFTREGILSTVQDLGRHGFMRFGINPNGVMDRRAARLINILLGNYENEAVVEMHFPAGEIRFESDAVFALGGADFAATLDSEPVSNWRAYQAKKGDILHFPDKRSGERAYLSVMSGFSISELLGSKSTNLTACFGGLGGRRIRTGDVIEFNSSSGVPHPFTASTISSALIPRYSKSPTVRILAGSEFELLTAISQEKLVRERFAVSPDSNRMGFRLKGEPIHLLEPREMVSSAVGFGTVQLLPDGQMIVLMADHQTSGGYPRIAHIIDHDPSLLAQLGPSDKVAFHPVTTEDAEKLTMTLERELAFLRVGVKFADKAA